MDPTSDDSTIDLVLRVLDHQIKGPDGELLGNVDNLLVSSKGGDLVVTGLVVGPGGWGPRLPGRMGRWTVAIWRRLRLDGEPQLTVVPMHMVQRIGASVEVDKAASKLLAGAAGFETWLRRYVVSRIPGATNKPDGEEGGEGPSTTEETPPGDPGHRRDQHLISALVRARVRDRDGNDLGVVQGIGAVEQDARAAGVGPLRIVGLRFGRHTLGSEWGYLSDDEQGPWVIKAWVRRWHRSDRRADLRSAHIDWKSREVVLPTGLTPGEGLRRQDRTGGRQ